MPSLAVRSRLVSVDILRGIVMVLMPLDHIREYFAHRAAVLNPEDLSETGAALFLTRWLTHFCAPAFAFLAGTGAFLSLSRGRTRPQLAGYLFSRGAFLAVLDPTVMKFFWSFNLNYRYTEVGILWVIGWSLMALAALVHLPRWAVLLFSITVIAGHNALDGIRPEVFGAWAPLWNLLHVQGQVEMFPGFKVWVVYPLLPWIGVAAAGYVFGALLADESAARRRRRLLIVGAAVTLVFVMLRWLNGYGDPRPWTEQAQGVWTLFSFLNCTKYPTSLLFLCMTLGPAIAALAVVERLPVRIGQWLSTLGRVPLFYYLVHIPLIHVSAIIIARLTLGSDVMRNATTSPPPGWGFDLPVIYLLWMGVVLAMYPVCRWFARVKQRRTDWWLGYL